MDDTLMNVGRMGLAVTLLVSFPLLAVPLIGTLVRAHREMAGQLGEGGVPLSGFKTSMRVFLFVNIPSLCCT